MEGLTKLIRKNTHFLYNYDILLSLDKQLEGYLQGLPSYAVPANQQSSFSHHTQQARGKEDPPTLAAIEPLTLLHAGR